MKEISGPVKFNNMQKAGSLLSIDLDAIAANYCLMRDQAVSATCACVVKADAYGLGLEPVVRRLRREGCQVYYVASLNEAITLRNILQDVDIVSLNGLMPGEELYYREYRLIPTLNDLGQVNMWSTYCGKTGLLPAALHIDTGMSRLGLSAVERDHLIDIPDLMSGFECRYLLSHLACADIPDHPLNENQKTAFAYLVANLPHKRASLAASFGTFLGPDWHFDMVRVGISLYGGVSTPAQAKIISPVISLEGLALQVRDVNRFDTVGYGAAFRFNKKTRVATVAVGYADGFFPSMESKAVAKWRGNSLPIVGKVSMDMVTLDATAAIALKAGDTVQLIGAEYDINSFAVDAGTIPYEILTALGSRYNRHYLGEADE